MISLSMNSPSFFRMGVASASLLLFGVSSSVWAQPETAKPQTPTLSPSQSNGTVAPHVARDADPPVTGVNLTLNTPQAVTNYWNNTYVNITGTQVLGEDVQIYDGDGQNDDAEYSGGTIHVATHAGVTVADPTINSNGYFGANGGMNGYHNCPRLPAPGKTYYFKAFGNNAGGNVIAESNEVSITMVDHPPSAVTLSASVGDYWSGGQKVDLSWTETTDPDSNYEATYTLCEADHPGVSLDDDNVLSSQIPSYSYYGYAPPSRTYEHYADGDPDPGKKHYYRLFVRDANNVVASNEIEVSVLQEAPDVLVVGTPRACAGAVEDGVHTFWLGISTMRDGWRSGEEELELSFEGNVGTPNKAKFLYWDDDWNPVSSETQTVTTDWYGNAYVEVLSSDTVSAPKLKIKWKGIAPHSLKLNDNPVSDVTCDFGKAQGKRRYGIIFCDQGADDDSGWDFDSNLFDAPGNIVPGIYALKWQADPTIAVDNNYFAVPATNPSDAPVPVASIFNSNRVNEEDSDYLPGAQVRAHLDDESNWIPVGNHEVELKIAEITPHEGMVLSSANLSNYAYFVDEQGYVLGGDGDRALDDNGQPFTDPNSVPSFEAVTTITLSSDYEGKVHFFLRGASLISEAQNVILEATDKTQHEVASVTP